MKKIRSYLITTSLLLGIAGSYYNNQAQVIAPPLKAYVETYFSPN